MKNLENNIKIVQESIFKEIKDSTTETSLESIRVKYLGRQGTIADLMVQLKELSSDEKRIIGPLLNQLKKNTQEALNTKKELLEKANFLQELEKQRHFDVTEYNPNQVKGSLHPLTYVRQKLEDTFITMGYEIVDDREVEDEYHNFTALNIPKDHPARDMQDTFWLTLPDTLMRTHTSSIQIRTMENRRPPLAIATLGNAYRNEATDASHDFMFQQTEILYINKNVSLADLLGTIKSFLQSLFNTKDLKIRTRPSYFPFTEPSIEVDMSCTFCLEGCSICKKTKWIELGGAGLVHPNVLKAVNINPEKYSGFAFGFGITRLVMLKYGINDIRLLHSNKLEFLQQF